jgi:hypothetical protein
MCEDKRQPASLLIVRSVTALSSGKKCCAINNGKLHEHRIKAENQRHEWVHIRGNVTTRSARKQMTFTRAGVTGNDWDVDFIAYGQTVTSQEATIAVGTVHSLSEDIKADLEYLYADPFNTAYAGFSVMIPVTL